MRVPLFDPRAAISRRGRADVYYNICVRASRCGKYALNPPTSQPIPGRPPSPAPAQRHARPEHFRSSTQRRCTPSPTARCIPRRRPSPVPAQRHALPELFRSPTQHRCTPAGCAMHARRPHNPFSAEDFRSPLHSDTPFPSTSDRPRSADARPRNPDTRPQAARCIPRRPTTPSPPKTFSRPRTATRPSRALPLPHAAPMHAHAVPTHARRLRDARPPTAHPIPRSATLPPPSVPLRAQKNGTAQCMCDAECLGRPSLRSVIWVGEPRAVRRRCGALACRRGA